MLAGYGNDNDKDGNDEDSDSADCTTTWKVYFILFFKSGAKSREMSVKGWGQGPKAEGRRKPILPKNNVFIFCFYT